MSKPFDVIEEAVEAIDTTEVVDNAKEAAENKDNAVEKILTFALGVAVGAITEKLVPWAARKIAKIRAAKKAKKKAEAEAEDIDEVYDVEPA